VIAGAIQDNDRGIILGRRTFGKGLVQQQMPLGQGDQIRLTTARYFTPTGRSIQRPYDASSKSEYYAEVRERYRTGEMEDPSNIPVNDSLVFTTPEGRKVYGGGGITPDIYISNDDSLEETWNRFLISSNYIDLFVFQQLNKNYKKYDFNNAPQFYNEPLPFQKEFIASFKRFCKNNSLPIEVNEQNEESILISIKAYIALQLFDENIYIRIINEKDPFIQRALDEIVSP
jgi:carboxyl-terminal processing protease